VTGRNLTALALTLTLAAPPALAAGVGKGNGEIGFDIGGTRFDPNTSNKDGGRFVFRGGYHFTDLFQIEGEIGASAVSDNGVDITLATTFVNAVFNFQTRRKTIVPYVLAGAGRARLEFDFGGGLKPDDTSAASHLAAGCRFFFGKKDRSAVRVEVSEIYEKTFDTSAHHGNLVGGFTWTLGQGR
jgi:outer membrane protein with beta-barrel domain